MQQHAGDHGGEREKLSDARSGAAGGCEAVTRAKLPRSKRPKSSG